MVEIECGVCGNVMFLALSKNVKLQGAVRCPECLQWTVISEDAYDE